MVATAMSYTHIEVEANENTPMTAMQVYKNIGEPFRVSQVAIYEGMPEATVYEVTGWSSVEGGLAVAAYAVQVEDSSEGSAYLVYGGDWGIRLRPVTSDQAWSSDAEDQFGETHLVLASAEDLRPWEQIQD
jgi:hypothetical protein